MSKRIILFLLCVILGLFVYGSLSFANEMLGHLGNKDVLVHEIRNFKEFVSMTYAFILVILAASLFKPDQEKNA